jgi:3',5'-cyclic-nucleotide phosphodiesterase
MKRNRIGIGLIALATLTLMSDFVLGQRRSSHRFTLIALGTDGGLQEGNLTSFLLAEYGSTEFVALDAGNLRSGIGLAVENGHFNGTIPEDTELSPEGWVLNQGIKAYLLTHAHLDHISGLVLNATDDSSKPILGLDSTVDCLRDHVFNWKVWPNFGSEGERPLNQYSYERLSAATPTPIAGTDLSVEAYPLSHSGYPSTAFLVQLGDDSLLFVGDTGPDAVEGGGRLREIWHRVAPLVREGRLRGILLECSYPDGRADGELYGHLTPSWVIRELSVLAEQVDEKDPERALNGLPVLIMHVKPSLLKGPTPRELIEEQLKAQNRLGVDFVLPEQGQRFEL